MEESVLCWRAHGARWRSKATDIIIGGEVAIAILAAIDTVGAGESGHCGSGLGVYRSSELEQKVSQLGSEVNGDMLLISSKLFACCLLRKREN
jgi:hypothetical protein